MAKKVVATLRTSTGKAFAKVYKMVRSQKTGAYIFEEKVMPQDSVNSYLENKTK